jgi:hypothetical protein
MLRPCFIPIVLTLLALTACSSSSRLKEYDFHNKRVMYRPVAECRSMSASVWVNDPAPGGKTPATGVAAIILSLFGSAAADAEFRNSVSTDGVAEVISREIEQALSDRFNSSSQRDGDGEADFIVETRLRDLALKANPDGVFLRVKVEQRLYDWRTRSRIYRQRFDSNVPLRFHSTGIADPAVMTVEGVISAARLLAMSEQEVQDAVLATSRHAGRLMADRFIHAAVR